MKKIAALSVALAALVLFVYFYEIEGEQKREEAKELEESLFRAKRDGISWVRIQRPDKDPITLQKEGAEWTIEEPIETSADGTSVDSFLRDLEQATRDRTLESVENAEKYGLEQPRMTISIGGQEEKTLLLGGDDFTGSKLYAQIQGAPEVFLTSDVLFTSADKELMDWRSKKVLTFERAKVQAIEIVNGSGEVRIEKQDDVWMLEKPIQEKADQSSVSGLLSKLEFAEAQQYVSEEAEELKTHGLDSPQVVVRVRQEGEDRWRALEVGGRKDEDYLARNPDRAPVFTIREDVFAQLNEQLWNFRDKDVVDLDQDEVTQLVIRRGEEEIALRHEELKWIIEKPEEQKDKEALSFKFWYPLDDVKFESISETEAESEFSQPDVLVIATLKDGSIRTFEFVKKGDRYLARRTESGRHGTISQESYDKLEIKPEDIV